MKSLFIILIIFFFSFTACKKNSSGDTQPQPTRYYQMSQEFLDYAELPVGAYYIYRDSATNTLDSVIVTTSSLNKLLYDPGPCTYPPCFGSKYYYDQLNLILQKTDNTGNQENWLTATGTAYRETSLLTGDHGETLLALPYVSDDILTIYTLSSLTLEGKVYKDVLVNISADDFSSLFSTTYWKKGIGILKRSYTINGVETTWTLVRNG
ncbi:MAG: hypothetical protein ABJA79_07975 [Parafilimonas sp.]